MKLSKITPRVLRDFSYQPDDRVPEAYLESCNVADLPLHFRSASEVLSHHAGDQFAREVHVRDLLAPAVIPAASGAEVRNRHLALLQLIVHRSES